MVFGVAGGSLTPLVIKELIRGSLNTVVPVQTLFAIRRSASTSVPDRYGSERTMVQFRAAVAVEKVWTPRAVDRNRSPAGGTPGQVGQPSSLSPGHCRIPLRPALP